MAWRMSWAEYLWLGHRPALPRSRAHHTRLDPQMAKCSLVRADRVCVCVAPMTPQCIAQLPMEVANVCVCTHSLLWAHGHT